MVLKSVSLICIYMVKTIPRGLIVSLDGNGAKDTYRLTERLRK